MNRVMKKGDAVVIVGYNSLLMDGVVVEDCSLEEMSNPNSIAKVDNSWVIGPADCFLVEGESNHPTMRDIRKKVKNAIDRNGYYWKIVLETKIPSRSKRKR